MEIIHVIVLIQVLALVLLGSLLVAVIWCIKLIDRSIKQRERILFNPSEPMPRSFKATATATPIEYPNKNIKPIEELPNVSGYKTQAQAEEEKLRAQAPDIEDLLPDDNE